jgi:hypothetical protein
MKKSLENRRLVCYLLFSIFTKLGLNNTKKSENVLLMRRKKGNKKAFPHKQEGCGDEWARTTDSRIFSPMLYQLSYITP